MSAQERQELEALTTWLATFPIIEETLKQKHNRQNIDLLADDDFSSAVMEVALEICHSDDGDESTMGHSGDVWDTVLNLTQRALSRSGGSNNKQQQCDPRRSLDPPIQDTPHIWNRHVQYTALANLLDGAVTHRDLQLRKEYIERIMGLSAETQRALMSLIEERRKKKPQKAAGVGQESATTKTPSRRTSRTTGNCTHSASKHKSNNDHSKSTEAASKSTNNNENQQSVGNTMSTPSPSKLQRGGHKPKASSTPLSSSSPVPATSRTNRASPSEGSLRSPFSPYAESIANSTAASTTSKGDRGRNKSPIPGKPQRRPQNLFLSPTSEGVKNENSNRSGGPGADCNVDWSVHSKSSKRSPRRSFDQAFGSDAAVSPARPSPKRIPVGSNEKSFFSPGLGDTAEIERQLQNLKETNQQLTQQLAKKEAKEDELAQQLEQSNANFRNEMMKVEAQARRKEEDAKAQYQEQLTTLKQELSKVQQQYYEAARAEAELDGVKDEMELMNHTKAQLAETQERLQSYREKLQQLNDVREALKREEDAHSKSVEECLRLEGELKAVQPLKRQLEEYKTRADEAEVKLAEAMDETKRVKEQCWTSDDASTDMERTLKSQQEEIMELRMRLQHETSTNNGNGQSSGVGDGLSELNPELKEEVYRLRNENQQLRDFAAKREDDAVAKLEQNLEDATRLSERYKKQYLDTRDQLEYTQRNLQASRDRETKLRTDVSDAMEKIKSTQGMVEDVSQQLYHCNEELTESRNREAELETELSTWVDQAKQLQDQNNSLSTDLRNRNNELEASKNREVKLSRQITDWQHHYKESQAKVEETINEWNNTKTSLETSHAREQNLQTQLGEWMSTANSLEERVKALNGQLDTSNEQLKESRANEERLTQQVEQATQFLNESNTKCEELVRQVTDTRERLATTQTNLEESQQRESSLQEELSDMTERAEDAESISKQRMELLQTTRDNLTEANTKIAQLQENECRLSAQVEEWTKQAQQAQSKSEELQKDLSDSTERLNEAHQLNDRQEKELSNQLEDIRELTQQVQDYQAKVESADALTERLQEELVELREVLNGTQESLQTSLSNETTMEEGFTHVEHMIFALEESVEAEIDARQRVEDELEDTLAQLEGTKQEMEEVKTRLSTQLEEQTEQSNKYKQDLFHSQETLNEIQGSLGATQHREKMLKLEISRLKDQIAELERELESAKQAAERAASESAQSMDATCEILNARAQKEIEEIQTNMNSLLEDERRAKRQSEEAHQQKLKEARQNFEKQLTEVKATAKQNLDETNKSHESRVQQLRNDHDNEVERLKKVAEDEQAKLVTKGKGMLKDVRSKAKEELDALRQEFWNLEDRLATEQQEKEKIISQAKTKVATYKKKLEFASSRINSLSTDSDELENKVRSLEREKFKLAEENDRYRRQLGGRGGPDSKLQSQIDLLQKEFKSAMEEARELRRKLKEKEDTEIGGMGSLDTIDENCDASYSRDAVNQSTLVQLRTEYEETIEALNDEKRELVMKNSAASTDVQKAEKRAWESEQENANLHQKITSLQLQIERLENLLVNVDEGPPPPPPGEPSSSKSSASRDSRGSRRSRNSHKTHETAKTDLVEEKGEEATEINNGFTDISSMTPSKSGDFSGSIDSFPTESSALCQAVYEAAKQPTGNVLASSNMASPNLPIENAKSPAPGAHDITKAQNSALPSFVELHGAATANDQEAPPECRQC